MPATSDVVIVGGGVIGCGIAYELAKRGATVTVVERGPIGGEASLASAGIISIPSRQEWSAARLELHRLGLARYPALRDELQERTPIDFKYAVTGDISLAVDDESAAARRRLVAWQEANGFPVTELTVDEARQREPALPENLHAAWLVPTAFSLSVHLLTRALAEAAASHGTTILTGTQAAAVCHDRGRASGVRLLDRELSAGTVILAAGAWTRFFGQQLGVELPTRPAKGQVMAVAGAPRLPRHILSGHGGFIRPRGDGSVVVAATYEPDAGFDRRVTGEGIAWLLDLVRTICPVLLQGEVIRTWTGLRPGTDTPEPMIGPVPGFDNLWVAAGHNRTGAVEAPATAELVADALFSGQAAPLLSSFAPPAG